VLPITTTSVSLALAMAGSTFRKGRAAAPRVKAEVLFRKSRRFMTDPHKGIDIYQCVCTLRAMILHIKVFVFIKQRAKDLINRYEQRVIYGDLIIENIDTVKDDGKMEVVLEYTIKTGKPDTQSSDRLQLTIEGT